MRILKYIMAASGCALLIFAFIIGKEFWEINEKVDRCFDDYSPAYIHDDTARAAACN
jgi:hypothetical protein